MHDLILEISSILDNVKIDLSKADHDNNKSAAQRIRVNSIKLEKLFKEFRKRSLNEITGKTKKV